MSNFELCFFLRSVYNRLCDLISFNNAIKVTEYKASIVCVSENSLLKMSLVRRKHVFGVSDQVSHKPACAATEVSWRLENSDIETRDIILSRQRTTNARIRLRGCAG